MDLSAKDDKDARNWAKMERLEVRGLNREEVKDHLIKFRSCSGSELVRMVQISAGSHVGFISLLHKTKHAAAQRFHRFLQRQGFKSQLLNGGVPFLFAKLNRSSVSIPLQVSATETAMSALCVSASDSESQQKHLQQRQRSLFPRQDYLSSRAF